MSLPASLDPLISFDQARFLTERIAELAPAPTSPESGVWYTLGENTFGISQVPGEEPTEPTQQWNIGWSRQPTVRLGAVSIGKTIKIEIEHPAPTSYTATRTETAILYNSHNIFLLPTKWAELNGKARRRIAEVAAGRACLVAGDLADIITDTQPHEPAITKPLHFGEARVLMGLIRQLDYKLHLSHSPWEFRR